MTDTIEKRYYTVSEIASQIGVNASAIRFWSSSIGIIPNRKTAYGMRKYTARQAAKFRKVKELSDTGKYTLAGIRDMIYEMDEKNFAFS